MKFRAFLLLAMLSLVQFQAADVVRAQARAGAPGGPPASIGPPIRGWAARRHTSSRTASLPRVGSISGPWNRRTMA